LQLGATGLLNAPRSQGFDSYGVALVPFGAGRNSQNKTRPLTPVPRLFFHAPNAPMPRWPDKIAAAVTFDVAFALNFKVGRTLRPLTDLERKVVAKNIVDHLQLSNWVIQRGAPGAHTSPENWPKRPD
jgi:hypothetical protein